MLIHSNSSLRSLLASLAAAAEAILIPLPPGVDHELVPKLDKSSYDDLSILHMWGNEHPHVLKDLTPLQTDAMVLKIKNSMERPEAGEILAKAMGPNFTCKVRPASEASYIRNE